MPWIQNVALSDIRKGQHIDAGVNSMLIQICDPPGDFPTPKHQFKEIHQFQDFAICQRDLQFFAYTLHLERLDHLLGRSVDDFVALTLFCVDHFAGTGLTPLQHDHHLTLRDLPLCGVEGQRAFFKELLCHGRWSKNALESDLLNLFLEIYEYLSKQCLLLINTFIYIKSSLLLFTVEQDDRFLRLLRMSAMCLNKKNEG